MDTLMSARDETDERKASSSGLNVGAIDMSGGDMKDEQPHSSLPVVAPGSLDDVSASSPRSSHSSSSAASEWSDASSDELSSEHAAEYVAERRTISTTRAVLSLVFSHLEGSVPGFPRMLPDLCTMIAEFATFGRTFVGLTRDESNADSWRTKVLGEVELHAILMKQRRAEHQISHPTLDELLREDSLESSHSSRCKLPPLQCTLMGFSDYVESLPPELADRDFAKRLRVEFIDTIPKSELFKGVDLNEESGDDEPDDEEEAEPADQAGEEGQEQGGDEVESKEEEEDEESAAFSEWMARRCGRSSAAPLVLDTRIYPRLPFDYLVDQNDQPLIYSRRRDFAVHLHMTKIANAETTDSVMTMADLQPFLRLLFQELHGDLGLPRLDSPLLDLISSYALRPPSDSTLLCVFHSPPKSPLLVASESDYAHLVASNLLRAIRSVSLYRSSFGLLASLIVEYLAESQTAVVPQFDVNNPAQCDPIQLEVFDGLSGAPPLGYLLSRPFDSNLFSLTSVLANYAVGPARRFFSVLVSVRSAIMSILILRQRRRTRGG